MVQIKVLSGKMAGHQTVARRFPFRIGRHGSADLPLDDAGVWEEHARLDLKRPDGFCLTALGEALVAVNGQSVGCIALRNGDRISVGSVQLQFWLAATRQRGLIFREGFVWGVIILITLVQVGLLYWLLR